MRTGIANMPLHGGKAPGWLMQRMIKLAREICLAIVTEFGTIKLLENLSDPYWFQALGCVLGFDWHSSGVTTTVCGAISEGLNGLEKQTGFFSAGGKGWRSRLTPHQIEHFGWQFSFDPERLVYVSKMSAKVDSAAVQDGFQLYHHNIFFTEKGDWAVVQQGMSEESRMARRYHWLSRKTKDFLVEPHSGICSDQKTSVLDLTAKDSFSAKKTSIEILNDGLPTLLDDLGKIDRLDMPRHHPVYKEDYNTPRLRKSLEMASYYQPRDFEELLHLKGVGPKMIRALSLVSEIIYGDRPSFVDPARFSFAHGGKDGFPYPVNRERYDKTICVLKDAIRKTRLGKSEKIRMIKSLQGK